MPRYRPPRLPCPCPRPGHLNLIDEEIFDQVRERVTDPRYVSAVEADLWGNPGRRPGKPMDCADINEQIFEKPKVLGPGRGNYYRQGQKECQLGYRLGGLEWCEDALKEFMLTRAQRKEKEAEERKPSCNITGNKKHPDGSTSVEVAIMKGVMPLSGNHLTTKDLERYAGMTSGELLVERREILAQVTALEKDLRIVDFLLTRNG